MKNLLLNILLVISMFVSYAQPGWNWPEDENLKSQALEKQAYYKLQMAQSNYAEALDPLNWLYENNPNLNTSIYIDGAKCIEEVMKNSDDADRIVQLQDSLLWMYDMRLEHFDNDAATMDRKAFAAFKLYYKTPSKYPMLAELFEEAYELNGPEIGDFNLNIYMMVAANLHKKNPEAMPAEKVLDIHTQISDIIESKLLNGGNKQRLEKEQSKTDGFLATVGEIISCEFIEQNLVPKFREDPSNISNAKKIYKYSVQAGCTGEDYWLEASETVYTSQPSFSLAETIGKKYLSQGELIKAMDYLVKAEELADNQEDKYDAVIGQAQAASKMGQKTKARSLCYEALSLQPGDETAYNLIGNLYFTSFDDCKGEKSQVLDRAVFIAAYGMYKKANNTKQMNASKEQFPSIENIFSEGYEEGDQVTISCWINETVVLARR